MPLLEKMDASVNTEDVPTMDASVNTEVVPSTVAEASEIAPTLSTTVATTSVSNI